MKEHPSSANRRRQRPTLFWSAPSFAAIRLVRHPARGHQHHPRTLPQPKYIETYNEDPRPLVWTKPAAELASSCPFSVVGGAQRREGFGVSWGGKAV